MDLDLGLLTVQLDTLFVRDTSGRLVRENDPDHSVAPLFWMAGCASGNVAAVRSDVKQIATEELLGAADSEPPLVADAPRQLDRFVRVLERAGFAPVPTPGLTYILTPPAEAAGKVRVVDSGTEEGFRLHRRLGREGLPNTLLELGFRDTGDLWAPWSAVVEDDEVASLAFAARLSDRGAEIGVVTARAHRGKGLAAAATAAWSRHPALRTKALFYSTNQANASSRRVAARLGLRQVGANLRL